MKRVKLIWLAVMAAFALTAVAVTATSASAAEPEWGHCVSVKSKGHYEDSNCTKEDFKENKKHEKKYKGKFEWVPGAAAACFPQKHGKYKDAACTEEDLKKGAPKGKYEKTGGPKFTGEGGAGTLKTELYACAEEDEETLLRVPHAKCTGPEIGFEAFLAPEVECASEHATGEATGTDEVGGLGAFQRLHCVWGPCHDTWPPGRGNQTDTLKGRLGYITKAAHEVGVLLGTRHGREGAFAEFGVLGGTTLSVSVRHAAEGACR